MVSVNLEIFDVTSMDTPTFVQHSQVKMADLFECECMVQGYHKYKDIWEAEVGTTLQCQRETGNHHDVYAVAVLKSGVIVGHVPKKISSTCSLFLRHGGAIHCTVTSAKRYSADIEQGGLEVPCVLKFVGDGRSSSVYKTKYT